jgi:hypothetical protein
VSLFLLSPEIEDRDEVEVDNWAKHKKTFYKQCVIITFTTLRTYFMEHKNIKLCTLLLYKALFTSGITTLTTGSL